MDTARIAALLEPFLEPSLPQSQLDQISTYIDLLLRWNARINLTAIRNEEEIVTRHFGESFFLARHLFPTTSNTCHPERSEGSSGGATGVPAHPPSAGYWVPGTDHQPLPTAHCTPRVLDIGSGAGFPALPLKLWAPHIHLTLIESNHKKAVFLREVARALTLTNINVINRPSPGPRSETHLPSRRSDPPSRRALRNHPPSSRNLPSPKRNPSPANNHAPDPPSVGPDQPKLASPNQCPKVTFKGSTNWIQSMK